jgi:hypothetical protein
MVRMPDGNPIRGPVPGANGSAGAILLSRSGAEMTDDTDAALRGIERTLGQIQGRTEAITEAIAEDRKQSRTHREKVYEKFDEIGRTTADAAAKAGAAMMEGAKVSLRVEALETTVGTLTSGLKSNTAEIARITPIVNKVELAQHRTAAVVWLMRGAWTVIGGVALWVASLIGSWIAARFP